MTVTLRKEIGQGGAYLGERSVSDTNNLLSVLQALAQGPAGQLSAYQATIATATIASMVAAAAGKITGLRTAVAVCGTGGSTTVQCQLNGVSVGELTTANDDADGTKSSLALDVDVAEGDLIQLVVTAAPTAGTGLTATAKLQPVIVED
jgi:hypothetical protein